MARRSSTVDVNRKKVRKKDLLAIVLAGIGVTLAALNSQSVTVDWILFSTSAPLVVVIFISAVLGALVAGLVLWRRS